MATTDILLFIVGILLMITTIKIVYAKNLIETIVIMSIFSLLICISYLLMDAPDVAMTEVALSGCLSTCILLKVIKLIKTPQNNVKVLHTKLAFILCSIFIAVLVTINLDLPNYGDSTEPVHTNVAKYYIENTKHDIGVKSFVAAILASYRGYDTLGETLVILIAGIGVLLVLNNAHTRR